MFENRDENSDEQSSQDVRKIISDSFNNTGANNIIENLGKIYKKKTFVQALKDRKEGGYTSFDLEYIM